MVWLAGKLQRDSATAANYVEDHYSRLSSQNNCAQINPFSVKFKYNKVRIMDDDLEAIVSIPEELDEFYSSSNVGEELALVQNDESCENILPFNFDVALSVIEGDDETLEEEIAEALCEISGEKSFPCNSCEKVCKSKGGLTRHVNAKHGNKSTKGHDNIPSLTKGDLHFIVNKVKTMITEDALHEKRRILRYSHVYTGVNKTHIATVF